MRAGALFLNESGQLLLVNPTYKPQWEIPGGIVEENESPRRACIREVQEELGLRIGANRLLSVAWQAPTAEKSESLMFIFWGGVLLVDEIAKIELPVAELSEYRFLDLNDALLLLTPTLGHRVALSYNLIDSDRTLYIDV